MNVLVTGSSGHVGSAIAARLAQQARVTGLDLRPGPYTTQVGDVGDEQLVKASCRGTDAVVHTAALHVSMGAVPDLARLQPGSMRACRRSPKTSTTARSSRGKRSFGRPPMPK
jgi:nucleoside-diphosphate-sugar epimerase